MEEYECIKVPFRLDVKDFRESYKGNSNILLHFLGSYCDKPWLAYLINNAITVESFKEYMAQSHAYDVYFHFYLDPKKATMYRIKYAQ